MRKDILIQYSEQTNFRVRCNGMIADRLNFEEMLGCVIRQFAELQGDKNRYFENEAELPI